MVVLFKPCQRQKDKALFNGALLVKQAVLVWQPAQGQDDDERTYPLRSITGQKKAKAKLMLIFSDEPPAVFLFNSEVDREALSKAIIDGQSTLEAQPKPPPPAAAAAAAAASADSSQPSKSSRGASPAGPSPTGPHATSTAATAAAAGGGGKQAGLPPAAPSPSPSAGAAVPDGAPGPSAVSKSAAAAAAGSSSRPSSAGPRPSPAPARPALPPLPSADERRGFLSQTPVVAAQYQKLVQSGALTEEEFWRSESISRLLGRDTLAAGHVQQQGISNKLPDVMKCLVHINQGQAQLKVPPHLRQQILTEKPHLKRAFMQHVPANMSEEEFWVRYFRYCQAKRDKRKQQQARVSGQGHLLKDPGDKGLVEDVIFNPRPEDEMELRVHRRRVNPAVDLDADKDGYEGYGLAHNAARSELESVKGYQSISQQLARDYNTHAAAVLQAGAPGGPAAAAGDKGGAGAGKVKVATADASEEEVHKIYENMGVLLEDLLQPPEQQFEELEVSDPRRYFSSAIAAGANQQQRPQPQQQQGQRVKAEGWEGATYGGKDALQLLSSVDPMHLDNPPLLPSVAQHVLMELDGLGGGEGTAEAAAQRLPPADALTQGKLDELRKQAMIVNELMRHFWALLPVNTDAKKKKFHRLQSCMEQSCTDINSLQDNSKPSERVAMQKLLRPLRDQLETALQASDQVKKAMEKQKLAAMQGMPRSSSK